MLKRNFVAIFGLLILLTVASCGDPITRSSGVVKDESGTPVADVKVVMESNGNSNGEFMKESEQITKADGVFDFGEITEPADKVRLVFTKEGYKSVTKDVTPNKNNEFDVNLEKQ